jgi:flagellar protein FliO/FliZ
MASSFATTLTALAALAVVLGLVWLASRAARWGGLAPRQTGPRRLVVQDAVALDARRRLTLVRCDDHSVLLLTGGAQDVVVGWVPQQWSVVSGQSPDVQRPDVQLSLLRSALATQSTPPNMVQKRPLDASLTAP